MKNQLLFLIFLSIPGSFYTGGVSSKNSIRSAEYIQWKDFDLKSQFRLLRLGILKENFKKWKLKYFEDWRTYDLLHNDDKAKFIALIVYLPKSDKYKVISPRYMVHYSKDQPVRSCYKDKFRNSYGMDWVERKSFEDKESTLTVIVQK